MHGAYKVLPTTIILNIINLHVQYIIYVHSGCTASRIVSLPHHRYVLQGSQATVRCQNRSDDGTTFNAYIPNAVWYRDYRNGTVTQVVNSQSVYADRHTLKFSPSVTNADEGVYYCCVLNGPCGNSSSAYTIVQISST